jgi:hypothetical protein
MEHDFMKRGYLLPEGCKDLMDVLKLKPKQEPEHPLPQHIVTPAAWLPMNSPAALPLVVGEILVPAQVSVAQLAELLGQKPFQIMADMMWLGIFASVKQPLSFEIISRVARMYGYVAKQAA